MRRLLSRQLLAPAALLVAAVITGCGGKVSADSANLSGAQLFNQRCSGCHSLKSANAYGSPPPGKFSGVNRRERTDGPNFNVRKEKRDDILFAIRNGGFSGAIMPANIVVGGDAQKVAAFLAKYSGKDAGNVKSGGAVSATSR